MFLYIIKLSFSSPVSQRWFSWEFHFFNANKGSFFIDGVVDGWEIFHGWSLSDSGIFIIHTSVANTDVSVVGTKIWNRDTSQVSADGRGDDYERFSSLVQNSGGVLIKSGGIWESIFLLNLFLGKSSNEDWDTVPDDLHDFGGWEFSNINFHIGISIVSLPSIKSSNNSESIDSGE